LTQIRQKTLTQNQVLIDLQCAFKSVTAEFARSKQLTEALKQRQVHLSEDF